MVERYCKMWKREYLVLAIPGHRAILRLKGGSEMKASIKQHFHWIIAIVVFLEIVVFGGTINSVSVYLIPITESLGVTRGEYALADTP